MVGIVSVVLEEQMVEIVYTRRMDNDEDDGRRRTPTDDKSLPFLLQDELEIGFHNFSIDQFVLQSALYVKRIFMFLHYCITLDI